ncbi:MAG: helix-turn-helix domain-containing protein [Xanthobacteraceae bacterium]
MQSNPIALKVSEACSVARVGRTCLYDAMKTGELRALKRGKSTLILADDLRRWLESLPTFIPKNSARNEAPRCGDQNATGLLSPTAKMINDDENLLRRPSVRHESVRKPIEPRSNRRASTADRARPAIRR